jgi:hypothetical protein
MKVDAKARANLRNLLNAGPEWAHDNWAMIVRGLAAAADDLDAYAEVEDQSRRGIPTMPQSGAPLGPPYREPVQRFSEMPQLPVQPRPPYVEPVVQAAEIIAEAIRGLVPPVPTKRKDTRKAKEVAE